ncbi:MAG: hypothetical protein AAF573_20085 [Bacteroidota bacterium]
MKHPRHDEKTKKKFRRYLQGNRKRLKKRYSAKIAFVVHRRLAEDKDLSGFASEVLKAANDRILYLKIPGARARMASPRNNPTDELRSPRKEPSNQWHNKTPVDVPYTPPQNMPESFGEPPSLTSAPQRGKMEVKISGGSLQNHVSLKPEQKLSLDWLNTKEERTKKQFEKYLNNRRHKGKIFKELTPKEKIEKQN